MDQEQNSGFRLRATGAVLIPYIALPGWLGCAYIFGDPERTNTPSFRVAKDVVPLEIWGLLFLAGSVALLLAGLAGNDRWIGAALFIGGAIYSWWGSLFATTLILDDHASLNGPMLYYFIAFCHFFGAWHRFTAPRQV